MNEQKIWDYLLDKLKNPYGVAALMGNLFAESSLNPISSTGAKKKLGMTNKQYTDAVDSGKYKNFVKDSIAYGLAQWCYHTRKKALLDKAKASKKSIGDIDLQLDYLWEEIQKYKVVINALLTATNVREASDVVLLKYENPANKSEKVKEKRAGFGENYYNKYNKSENIMIKESLIKYLMSSVKNLYEEK